MTPSNTKSSALLSKPWNTSAPKPPAPISAAITAMPTVCTATTRRLRSRSGSASGSWIFQNRWLALIPIALALSSTSGDTWLNPATTPRASGSNAYSTSAISAGVSPVPAIPMAASAGKDFTRPASGAISRPKRATDGMVWITFSTVNTGPWRLG
ncbi:hypothetical protein D3C86_1728590 [compost metagenome]